MHVGYVKSELVLLNCFTHTDRRSEFNGPSGVHLKNHVIATVSAYKSFYFERLSNSLQHIPDEQGLFTALPSTYFTLSCIITVHYSANKPYCLNNPLNKI
jgi:hypothetical protein